MAIAKAVCSICLCHRVLESLVVRHICVPKASCSCSALMRRAAPSKGRHACAADPCWVGSPVPFLPSQVATHAALFCFPQPAVLVSVAAIAACIEFCISCLVSCVHHHVRWCTCCAAACMCLGSAVCPAKGPILQQLGCLSLADLPSVLCFPSALLGSSSFGSRHRTKVRNQRRAGRSAPIVLWASPVFFVCIGPLKGVRGSSALRSGWMVRYTDWTVACQRM